MTGQATPMADFLSHQNITSVTDPSRMHSFVSTPPEERYFPNGIPVRVSGGSPSIRIATIDTPFQNATTQGSQPQVQFYYVLQKEFALNPRTMKYTCNTCQIEVNGAECAHSHLIGSKHAKQKAKAIQLQVYHMPLAVTNAPRINTQLQPPSLAALNHTAPPSPRQTHGVGPTNPSGSSLSIEVLHLLKREFTLDPQTMKYTCNTCGVDATGAESAHSHLIGAKHAKQKAKVIQLQVYQMPRDVTNAPPNSTLPPPPPMPALNQPTPPAPRQSPGAYPTYSSGSSIEVLDRGGAGVVSPSSEVSYVPGTEFPDHYPGAIGSIDGFHRWCNTSGYASGGTICENDFARPLRGVSMENLHQC